jgi:hypothetical protein
MPMKALFGGWANPIVAKTADYTVLPSDIGTCFTNRGASGTVIFTLPLSGASLKGWWCEFHTCAAQVITVTSNAADTLIVHADLTADTLSTAATIGQHIRVISDGTGMMVIPTPSAADSATAVTAITIAT